MPANATQARFDRLDGGFGIWVSGHTAREQAGIEEDATNFAKFLSRAGVRLVLLEARTVGGEVIFPSYTHSVLDGDEGLLQRVVVANERHGIETVPVLALFLGTPEEGQSPVQAGIDLRTGEVRLAQRRVGADGVDLPYSSLFDEVVRYRTDLLLRELARVEGLRTVSLSHVGFPGHTTDFREEARVAFEQFLGDSVAPWPQAVLAASEDEDQEPRIVAGRLWQQWARWRTGVVSTLMFQATGLLRAESDMEFDRPLDVALVASGYLDQRVRTGVNWVSVEDQEEPGIAELFDRLFLELYAPIVTRQEAGGAGLQETASLEHALDMARRRVPEGIERWAVISLIPYQNAEGRLTTEGRRNLRRALRLARSEQVPVVLMDYELMRRGTAWDDVRAALTLP